MSVAEKSTLITWTTGVPEAPTVLLLHDRYLDHDASDALGAALAGSHRVVSVRAPRTQMEMGFIKGYFWFLGPLNRPELSTFGDGLHQLERLVMQVGGQTSARVAIAGVGEGGVLALLIGLLWPELVSAIVAIDAGLPDNLDDFPLDLPPPNGLPVLLVERERDLAAIAGGLSSRGTAVERLRGDDATVASWLSAHQLASARAGASARP